MANGGLQPTEPPDARATGFGAAMVAFTTGLAGRGGELRSVEQMHVYVHVHVHGHRGWRQVYLAEMVRCFLFSPRKPPDIRSPHVQLSPV